MSKFNIFVFLHMELIKKEKKIFKELLINEKFQIGILLIVLFAIPFFFKSPQFVIGTIVNFLLIVSFSKFGLRKIYTAFFLPSIATYLSGTIFGGATIFLLYIMPFIVFSNFSYTYLFNKIRIKGLNILISSGIKALFLFLSALVLHKTVGLPALFLTTMGINQFFTAFTGATLAFFFLQIQKGK